MKKFLDGLKFGIGISFACMCSFALVMLIHASWQGDRSDAPDTSTPIDENPSYLYAKDGNPLTAEKWNALVDNQKTLQDTKFSEIKICQKTNRSASIRGKNYDCDGTVINTNTDSTQTYINCPSGYKAISGGHYTTVLAEGGYTNSTPTSNRYRIKTSGTLNLINVVCVK